MSPWSEIITKIYFLNLGVGIGNNLFMLRFNGPTRQVAKDFEIRPEYVYIVRTEKEKGVNFIFFMKCSIRKQLCGPEKKDHEH